MVDLITEINRFPPFRLFPVTEINRPPYRRGGNRLRRRLLAGEVSMIDLFSLEQQTPPGGLRFSAGHTSGGPNRA